MPRLLSNNDWWERENSFFFKHGDDRWGWPADLLLVNNRGELALGIPVIGDGDVGVHVISRVLLLVSPAHAAHTVSCGSTE